jgi:hypothetical protein
MAGHIEVEGSPSSVVEHEPNVEQGESHSGDDEEVHSRDHVLVIPQEGHPPLLRVSAGGAWSSGKSWHKTGTIGRTAQALTWRCRTRA